MHCIITAESVSAVRGTVGRGLLCALLVSLLSAAGAREIGAPFDFSPRDRARAEAPGRLRVAGALALRSEAEGTAVPREISGLAWSEDDDVLYAVTDAGWLLQLRPRIVEGRLVGVSLLHQARLADAGGQALPRRAADAEGLAVLDAADGQPGNTRLLISFEGTPLVAEHATDGRRLRVWPLPSALQRAERYDSANHGLEALALLPGGAYVVALEKPLRGADTRAITLHADDGRQWRYPVDDARVSSITGLDTLPDGSLMAVERRYAGLLSPVVCTLSRLRPDGERLLIEPLARYSSAHSWPVDNFEAIAVHRENRFFIASDDNENPLQQALLIYFEVLPVDEER